jgi:hypothetical protein
MRSRLRPAAREEQSRGTGRRSGKIRYGQADTNKCSKDRRRRKDRELLLEAATKTFGRSPRSSTPRKAGPSSAYADKYKFSSGSLDTAMKRV